MVSEIGNGKELVGVKLSLLNSRPLITIVKNVIKGRLAKLFNENFMVLNDEVGKEAATKSAAVSFSL